MNLYEAVRMQRIRAAVRAVRTGGACSSVWRCARYSVRTVMRVAVCGSALGSVWQCARQCAAVQRCGSVWQCTQQCAAVCSSVWQCVAVRLAVCGSALYILLCTQSFTIYILVCPYRGSGGEPHTPHILIRTNRSIWVINTNWSDLIWSYAN